MPDLCDLGLTQRSVNGPKISALLLGAEAMISAVNLDAETMVTGMEAALARLGSALRAWEHPEIPLFESLNWLVSLQDLLRTTGRDHPDLALIELGASVFSGLRWVRNTVHHDWLRAIRLVPLFPGYEGTEPPQTFPGYTENLMAAAWSYRWVPADELDPITPERQQDLDNPKSTKVAREQQWLWNQRMDYEHHVRMSGVEGSLRHALTFASAFLARLEQ